MASQPGVVPHLMSSDGNKHIEWLKAVFDGKVKEIFYKDDKKDKVMHCTMAVNGGLVYLADGECDIAKQEQPEDEPCGFLCHLDVEDPNAVWSKAMSNGSTVVNDLKVQSWGQLYGSFKDPFGFVWSLMKRGESLAPGGVIPYLLTPNGDCDKHIDWLKAVFNGEVKEIFHNDDNKVMHCAVAVNGGFVYVADGACQQEQSAGKPFQPRRLFVHMDFPDPRKIWKDALDNGSTTIVELKVQFWGELYGRFKDTFGFMWSLGENQQSSDHPKGVIPYLLSPDCEKHVEWISNVFGGEVKEKYRTEDNSKIMHCKVAVNGGFIYLADISCTPEQKSQGDPQGFLCHLELPDANVAWKKAMANGAISVMDLKMQFWGSLYGSFKDPFGYEWGVMETQKTNGK